MQRASAHHVGLVPQEKETIMNFNKFATSPLTEVFTKQDWDYFNSAYGIGYKSVDGKLTAAEKAKRGRARKWIISVLDVFALKLDITTAQAKQLFELGDCAAIKSIYRRMLPAMEDQLSRMPRSDLNGGEDETEVQSIYASTAGQELHARVKTLKKMSEMESQDVINAVRAEWTRALSIQHPAFERHLMSGKSGVRQGEESKVQGKRGSTPIVESKRPSLTPNEKFAKKIDAARGHAAIMTGTAA
jgi:hypothetical protein